MYDQEENRKIRNEDMSMQGCIKFKDPRGGEGKEKGKEKGKENRKEKGREKGKENEKGKKGE